MKRGEEPQAWTKAMTVHSHPLPYAIVECNSKQTVPRKLEFSIHTDYFTIGLPFGMENLLLSLLLLK